jgi:hypothetical protein
MRRSTTLDNCSKRYLGMKCPRALRIAAAAYIAPIVPPLIYYPNSGGILKGGRFYVGHLTCWADARGSDFRNGACWAGHGRKREYVKFADHRNY